MIPDKTTRDLFPNESGKGYVKNKELTPPLKTGNFSSSPNAFIGDPMFLKKNMDPRSKALRE